MTSPNTCRFSDSHEWFLAKGQEVTMGITQFAANELTDVTYVQLKPVGTAVKAGDTIAAVNEDAVKDPSLLNSDPFGRGWLVKLNVSDTAPLSKLMDAATYDSKHAVH